MKRKIRKLMMGVGVICQIMTMLIYSFGEVTAPKYYYLLVWILGAALIRGVSDEAYVS